MTTYNPAEVERLVREAKERAERSKQRLPFPPTRADLQNAEGAIAAMADQLDAARLEIDRLRPIVEAVAGAAVDQTIGSVKVYTVGERVTAQYLPVAAAEAVRNL